MTISALFTPHYYIIQTLVSIIAIAYLFYSRQKLKRIIIRYEQQMLLSQMNPHFVFNSLTAIQSFIFRNEPHQASKYLASFAKLTRLILENSRTDYCSIEREITTLKPYLELQKLRFENRFDYEITISKEIDASTMLIPPMLAQPFIENAIEHGLNGIDWPGKIEIRYLLKSPRELIVEVDDNGIGISKARELQVKNGKQHKSLATDITMERIKSLKKLGNRLIRLKITDKKDLNANTEGTLVQIQIPLR